MTLIFEESAVGRNEVGRNFEIDEFSPSSSLFFFTEHTLPWLADGVNI